MPPTPATVRRVQCIRCSKSLTLMPGDMSTACKDLSACNSRMTQKLQTIPAPDHGGEANPFVVEAVQVAETIPSPREEEAITADKIAQEQRRLAGRAIGVSHLVITKMEDALEHGTEVTLKDGSTIFQPVPPMALAAILRELRPIVQEPVRAAEAEDLSQRPLISINLNDPDVVRAALQGLRARRERKVLEAFKPETHEEPTQPPEASSPSP